MARKSNGSSAPNRKKKAVVSVMPTPAATAEETRKTVEGARLEEEIRLRAYQIYLERNGSPGDEHQDWLVAEREVRARYQQQHLA